MVTHHRLASVPLKPLNSNARYRNLPGVLPRPHPGHLGSVAAQVYVKINVLTITLLPKSTGPPKAVLV